MVERLQKSEIPAGWDLWNFQSALQKIYTIPTFSTKTKQNLAEYSGKPVISCILHISKWLRKD